MLKLLLCDTKFHHTGDKQRLTGNKNCRGMLPIHNEHLLSLSPFLCHTMQWWPLIQLLTISSVDFFQDGHQTNRVKAMRSSKQSEKLQRFSAFSVALPKASKQWRYRQTLTVWLCLNIISGCTACLQMHCNTIVQLNCSLAYSYPFGAKKHLASPLGDWGLDVWTVFERGKWTRWSGSQVPKQGPRVESPVGGYWGTAVRKMEV